jgi:DNA-binding PadR family transcriptional regulator
MLEKGWIRALPGEGGDRKKEYEITEPGKAVAASELARLRELLRNGEAIIEA